MKKFILIGLIVFSYSSIYAQKFNFGLRGVPALAWLKSDTKTFESSGSKLGFSYGIMMDYNFTDNYSFSSGIDITSRGGKLENKIDSITYVQKYKLQFIEIPLTLKMRTNEIGYLTYFGQFGFTPGAKIKAIADIDSKTPSTTTTLEDIDINKEILGLNIDLVISLGVEYSLGGNASLYTALKFNNGFIDILKEKDNVNVKARSNYLGLGLGIFF